MASYEFPQESTLANAGSPPTWGFQSYLDAEPAMGFFINVPENSLALFSTENGTKPRRNLQHFVPPRHISPWTARQIQDAVDVIKVHCWSVRKSIQLPSTYYDLYHYFDGYDLWHMGVQNCWNILNHLFWETQRELPALVTATRSEIESWADELIRDNRRRQQLYNWDSTSDSDVLRMFKGEELMGLDGLDEWYLPIVRDVLYRVHGTLHHGTYLSPVHETQTNPVPAMITTENKTWVFKQRLKCKYRMPFPEPVMHKQIPLSLEHEKADWRTWLYSIKWFVCC
jgi:hypothetical protein